MKEAFKTLLTILAWALAFCMLYACMTALLLG